MVPINYWAIIAAALASMILGWLWYGPVFGKQWLSWSGITMGKEEMRSGMGRSYTLMLAGSLFMAYVLAHSVVFANAYLAVAGVSGGLMAGFWNWLGFIAPVTLGPVLWEKKPWKLWLLNNGYYLLTLLVMGAILSVWQ